jgi:hypothetical protein
MRLAALSGLRQLFFERGLYEPVDICLPIHDTRCSWAAFIEKQESFVFNSIHEAFYNQNIVLVNTWRRPDRAAYSPPRNVSIQVE